MRRIVLVFSVLSLALVIAAAAEGASVSGVVTDTTGATLPEARVVLRDIATSREQAVTTAADGRYTFAAPPGSYLLIISRAGFAAVARTVIVEGAEQALDLPVTMEVGALASQVTVTAARGERELRRVPLHVETISDAAVEQTNPLSTGDALTLAANVTPVGNGPFGVRPRLRGLDSTRVLVLVDGERLNTARMATDRTGAEVGLVATDTIDRMEIVNGAGTLLYGSDALAGTINIITGEPSFSERTEWLYGFNGFYSSNEDGMRGTVTLGATTPRVTFRLQTGAERYDRYTAGHFDVEDTTPFFTSGRIDRGDTIDDNFGFAFGAFPDPFNAPYVRTSDEIPNSQAHGNFVNASGQIRLGERRSLRVRYLRRRMNDVGFPDFAQPYFFNATSLPFTNLDKVSARYEAQQLTPWLANLSVSAYYQRTERMLQNLLPVQFPVPSAVTFLPIAVMRLDILSQTEQRVWTPGVDVLAVFVPRANHLLTAGLTFYRDRSSDRRTTETTTSLVGQVVLGPRGPAPVVNLSPIALGPPAVSHPVRVPDASFRDIAVFAQDEWRVRPNVSIVAGLRGDFYDVGVEATPGYDVTPVVAGARPAIDPSTLPAPEGGSYSRNALTGDIGVVANPDGRFNPFVRYGRSYRHPNLEEMLFAGAATAGSLAPNVRVEPETGDNVDFGAKFRAGRVSGGAYVFVNQYHNFISQDVVATTPAGLLSQAVNYGDVRITGLEVSADAPLNAGPGVVTLSGAAAFTRGTITEGTNAFDGSSLAGTPMDNITPAKVVLAARYTGRSGRWWAEYGLRAQAEVTRVAETLLNSAFIIPQDLLALDGLAIQRIGWGVNFSRGRDRVGLVFAVENLANTFYREQFQFAPARGRSFTMGVNVGAF